ncbi:hypothetical protein FRC11_005498, partial [Ceratobasidium sp. 423]
LPAFHEVASSTNWKTALKRLTSARPESPGSSKKALATLSAKDKAQKYSSGVPPLSFNPITRLPSHPSSEIIYSILAASRSDKGGPMTRFTFPGGSR